MTSSESVNNSSPLEDQVDISEDDFVWQDYLEITNSEEVPQTLFAHVEQSLQSGLEEGMKLEVPITNEPEYHWVASIVMACGPLLRLRYLGDKDDRSNDFWCDLTKVTAHPLGWCEENKKTLCLPSHLKEKVDYEKLKYTLKDGLRVPAELLTGEGVTPVDRIKQGMKLEIQDKNDPYRMWIATIIENIGGRLLLRYDTPDSNSQDFWLFYSSPRVFPVGWTQERGAPWVLRRPSDIDSKHGVDEWDAVLESSKIDAQKMPLPKDVLSKIKTNLRPHDVNVGMKLEAVHPGNMKNICPASVIKVFDSYYFLVGIDVVEGTENKFTWLASIMHPYIFPVGWAKENKIKLTSPRGWISEKEEFDWSEYLAKTESVPAPLPSKSKIKEDVAISPEMKLEAVNPERQHQVCVSTVKKLTQHLLWLSLDSVEQSQQNIIFNIDSLDIFPVGWCESNSYPLKAPKMCQFKRAVQYEERKENGSTEIKSSVWCPKIYFNHKCFSGPFLSKGRLASLPKAVGPGPVLLVLKEVLTLLISVAYISSRVLKELQLSGTPKPGSRLEILKAKYKANVYKATVEIVNSSDKVEEFCKDICRKLQVCPYMFGPTAVGEKCPENCHTLSKTRFLSTSTASTQSILIGRRKAGRPPDPMRNLATDSLFSWPRRPQPFQKELLTRSDNRRQAESDGGRELKAKKMRYETRGVKLPNFGLVKNNTLTPNKQTSSASETSSVASFSISCRDLQGKKKRGRKSKVEAERLRKIEEIKTETKMDDSMYHVNTNPLFWSMDDLYKYLKSTHDCNILASLLREEEFDGKSFMLLNLPSCLESLHLNLKTALSLCRHVEAVKYAFFCNFVPSDKPSYKD